MIVLLTGGCGFIGSHVAEVLEARGAELVILDRNADRKPKRTSARYIQGEFGNRGVLERVFADYRISHVVHLVSSTVPGNSNHDPEFDVRTNVGDTIALLDLCVRNAVKRVLFLSSGGTVYGIPRRLPVDEDHPTNPISSYGITKLAIEKYLNLYHHIHGLSSVAIRAANPYGPRQPPNSGQGVISTFAHRILHGQTLEIWGDGSVVRDYFDVRDLASLCALALESQHTGEFNAGSGIGRSLLEVIASLEQAVGKKARVQHRLARPLDVPKIVLECSRARNTFGWEPSHRFEQGLADVRRWLVEEWPAT